MQLDGALQLPDGQQISVVLELDAADLETGLADTQAIDLVVRATKF